MHCHYPGAWRCQEKKGGQETIENAHVESAGQKHSLSLMPYEKFTSLAFVSVLCLVAALIPGFGRSPGIRNGKTFQFSCLKNSMDRGAWWATVYGVAKSQTHMHACTHTHTHTHMEVLMQQIHDLLDQHSSLMDSSLSHSNPPPHKNVLGGSAMSDPPPTLSTARLTVHTVTWTHWSCCLFLSRL